MDTAVIVAVIIAVVVLVVVFLLRERIVELSVNGKEAKLEAKLEAKAKAPQEDEKPVSVTFKGNKIRGEGEYRMQQTDFSENDIDGKQKLELGYGEPSNDVQSEEK